MQNYIKTNILSLGQHVVFLGFFFCRGDGKCQEFRLRKKRKEEGGKKKKKKPGIKFTFRPTVYVPLISSLFSD